MANSFLGQDIPKLGFGLMRLPKIEGEIDIEQTKRMVDYFLENGFTYFDTAYVYEGGKSEMAVKEALTSRHPRETYQIATKLPPMMVKEEADLERIFNTHLERMGTDYIDYYLLHSLDVDKVKAVDEFDMWAFCKKKKAEGKIRHYGFSFHDEAPLLEEILTAHPEAEFVQLQLNYADWESNSVQARQCYEIALRHGMPIIVMEPVKGGALAELPPAADALLKAAAPGKSAASWALRYTAGLENIVTILSGMSNFKQMEDNVACLKDPAPLSDEEKAVIAAVVDVINSIPTVPCTSCRYCIDGCPMKIDIPGVFSAFNEYKIYGNLQRAKGHYGFATMGGAGKASDCIACGACEAICPQHIAIIEELGNAATLLED